MNLYQHSGPGPPPPSTATASCVVASAPSLSSQSLLTSITPTPTPTPTQKQTQSMKALQVSNPSSTAAAAAAATIATTTTANSKPPSTTNRQVLLNDNKLSSYDQVDCAKTPMLKTYCSSSTNSNSASSAPNTPYLSSSISNAAAQSSPNSSSSVVVGGNPPSSKMCAFVAASNKNATPSSALNVITNGGGCNGGGGAVAASSSPSPAGAAFNNLITQTDCTNTPAAIKTNGCLSAGPPPAVSRTISSDRLVTGPSCKALRTAVSALYSVDDFVKEKIGSGFFSEVYKVTHRTTGQVMVLKMNQLRANRSNMLREVQLLNKLSHPNILSFMGVCVQEGQLHALTEYINGGSLEQLLAKKDVVLTAAMKLRLAMGIAQGMAYVHDAGVFHRDLTSKNVLIRNLPGGQYESVVGDFGLATKIPDKKLKTRLDYVGSPYWVSPECLKNQFYDEKSDVFSFGIICCEIIARIEADPDIMPRSDSFGLDYLAFVELCPMDTPPVFLRLAFYCCIYDPKSRPTFHDAIKKLNLLLEKYEHDPIGNCSSNHSITSASSSPLSSLDMTCSPNGSDSENACQAGIHQNGCSRLVCAKKATTTNAPCISTAPAGQVATPRHIRDVSENGFLFPDHANRSNSIPNGSAAQDVDEGGIIQNRVKRATKKYEAAAELLMQQHRRSLSENIIHFPLHTTPSDKARCHQMNRQRSSTHSPTPPPVGGSASATAFHTAHVQARESPPPVLTLRKVAETMCLKDALYKPTKIDNNGVKSNPFTALAQLRRVKKILGANPKTYAAGVGDLFSSCFEMCAPFFKEMAALQPAKPTNGLGGDDGKTAGVGFGIHASASVVITSPNEPKSLPTSPQLTRKYSAIELKLSPTLPLPRCTATEADDDDCVEESDAEQDADGGGNCADAESSSDDSAERPAANPVTRKYRANSLFAHPLFRGNVSSKLEEQPCSSTMPTTQTGTGALANEDCNSSEDGTENVLKSTNKDLPISAITPSPPTPPPPPPSTASVATPASVSSCTDFDLNDIKPSDFLPTKSSLTRRDSIESGFYSCFNEESDAATTYRQFNGAGVSSLGLGCGGGNCCFEQLKSQLMLDVGANGELSDKLASLCRCCYYGSTSHSAGHHQQFLNDSSSTSSSVLMIDEPTSSGGGGGGSIGINSSSSAAALRSFDDLELPDATRRRYTCHHHLLGATGGNPHDPNFTATAGLINRLALDSEIHSLMQRSPFATNQLLYCKNRTSSIYTDSSDDISSLAGSDSLLWDERSFAYPPSTRSAQIAKIVEYFERKRQVPDSIPPPRGGGSTGSASGAGHSSATGSGSTSSSSSMAAAVAASALGPSYLSYESRRYSDFKRHAAINSDYEAFCFELDKKPTQARLMVCEGAVKSKLQIFDKLKQQPTCSNNSATITQTGSITNGGAVAMQQLLAAGTATTSNSTPYTTATATAATATSSMTASTGSITPTQTPTSTTATCSQLNTSTG